MIRTQVTLDEKEYAQAKKEALEAKGIRVGTTPTETAQLVAEIAAA